MPDLRYQYDVLECTSCFVCCTTCARFYGVDRGHMISSASSTTTNVGLAHTYPITMVHTDMQSWIHNVFHDIFYQQEHFGPRKQWQRTSYSVCKILCVSVVVYVVSDHEQTDILW